MLGTRRIKEKLDINNAMISLSLVYFLSLNGINSLLFNEASLQPVLASALHSNSVPIETLDKYGAPIFWAFTYSSNSVIKQFYKEIGNIQISIIDSSFNLRIVKYSTIS